MQPLYYEIDTPALLIEKSILENNIQRMQDIANRNKVKFRPHIKTHKIPKIAKMQLEAGACGIASAKLSEAEVMFDAGIEDIQIANMILGRHKLHRLCKLASKADRVSVCVDSVEAVNELALMPVREGKKIGVFVEIDTGLGRCGLKDFGDIHRLCKYITHQDNMELRGILTHAGHVYGARSSEEVAEIGTREGKSMSIIAERLRKNGILINEVSVGSTPTAASASAVKGVTELRTGVYVFNDMMQVALGSATLDNCALSILSTVISTPGDRVIIDAGSKALSLDKGAHGNDKLNGHGYIYDKTAVIYRLSEEHGLVYYSGCDLTVGSRVRIVPNHACAVVNLYDFAYLVDRGEIIDVLDIEARGKIT